MRFFVVAALLMSVSTCARFVTGGYSESLQSIQPGKYLLDPAHSSVLFKVGHLGLSEYVGRFNRFEASLEYDLDGSSAARLQAIVDTASIDVNNPAFAKTLRGSGWLDTDRYPRALLRVDGLPRLQDGALVYQGTLDWRGVVQPLQLRVVFNAAAQNRLTGRFTLGFAASTEISRQAFGITRAAGLVGDSVALEIHAEFQRSRD